MRMTADEVRALREGLPPIEKGLPGKKNGKTVNGWTRRHFAEYAGIRPSTYYSYEVKGVKFAKVTCKLLNAALQLEMEWRANKEYEEAVQAATEVCQKILERRGAVYEQI